MTCKQIFLFFTVIYGVPVQNVCMYGTSVRKILKSVSSYHMLPLLGTDVFHKDIATLNTSLNDLQWITKSTSVAW